MYCSNSNQQESDNRSLRRRRSFLDDTDSSHRNSAAPELQSQSSVTMMNGNISEVSTEKDIIERTTSNNSTSLSTGVPGETREERIARYAIKTAAAFCQRSICSVSYIIWTGFQE